MNNSNTHLVSRAGILCSSLAVLLASSIGGPVMAQDDSEYSDAGVLEEVIVTATKRAENIQDIPHPLLVTMKFVKKLTSYILQAVKMSKMGELYTN